MSITVDGIEVPVVWRPSDLTGPDSDGHTGRLGHAIRAIVHHRVVGSLESMVNTTFAPTSDNVLRIGERRVSSHFGIGFWGDELRIYQFVALQDTAYCNGQSEADRAACTWSLWLALGKPPANEITVSIEHEDNGKAGGYVVAEPIIRASIELDRLLLTGDGPRIRAAGIRCDDEAARQLGRITPSTATIIDHHVVAPVSKPYCWRAIGQDPGFPRARYVRALTEPAPSPEEVVKSYPVPSVPTIGSVAAGTWLYDNTALQPSEGNLRVEPGRDLPYLGQPTSTYRVVEYVNGQGGRSGKAMFIKPRELTNIRPEPDLTPHTAADVEAARRAGWNNARERAIEAVTAVPRK